MEKLSKGNDSKKIFDNINIINSFDFPLLDDLEEWNFGNDKNTANILFDLVKIGKKTATSYLYKKDEKLSKNGEFSILTNYDKSEKILLKTKNVKVVKFKDVSLSHAQKEGEGDMSLADWKNTHENFFKNELKTDKFSEETKIVCEEFEVVKKIK